MDFSLLATNVVALLSPYLVKGGEAIAGEVSKDLYTQAKKLKDRLWLKVKDSKDTKLIQTASLFEMDPETFSEAMRKVLTVYLQKNPQYAEELLRQTQNIRPNSNSKYNVQIGRSGTTIVGDHTTINQNSPDIDD